MNLTIISKEMTPSLYTEQRLRLSSTFRQLKEGCVTPPPEGWGGGAAGGLQLPDHAGPEGLVTTPKGYEKSGIKGQEGLAQIRIWKDFFDLTTNVIMNLEDWEGWVFTFSFFPTLRICLEPCPFRTSRMERCIQSKIGVSSWLSQ